MGDSQQFCLKWNNHHSNLLSVFDDLYKQQSFCDVTLACDGTVIRAHKNVLSACSPFFHAVFMANPCKHPVVILKDIRFSDLKALVEFMYRGEVNVSQEELPVLLKVAEALKIRGLAGSENGSEEPSRRRSKRKRRRKSASDGESAGSGSDTEPELVRTPITKKSAPVVDSQSSSSAAAVVPSSSHHDIHSSHPKEDHHTPASTPPVIRSATSNARQQQQDPSEEAEFEPTDILEATMATHLQSTSTPTVSDTRQSGAATANATNSQASSQQASDMTETLVIPDDTELDIKPIINFDPVASSAVPSTSQALQPSHSGASNSSSSMMDSNMDSSDMTTFAEAGLPSTSSGGAAGSAPHGMYEVAKVTVKLWPALCSVRDLRSFNVRL